MNSAVTNDVIMIFLTVYFRINCHNIETFSIKTSCHVTLASAFEFYVIDYANVIEERNVTLKHGVRAIATFVT